jgi:ABC-type multidrug transport system fused ATPase/permease subunit
MVVKSSVAGKILMGTVYSFIASIWGSISSADNVAKDIAMLLRNNMYISNLFSLLDRKTSTSNIKKSRKKKIVIDRINSIEFHSVSFRYKEKFPYSIEDISFKISSNNRVAIVGKNGSGKSTVMKLICGFYDNYEGEILINGYSLHDIDIESYRKQINAVFQDFSKYAFTVDENLNLGDIKAVNKDHIYNKFNQLREYGLLSFVEKLPKKINTQLGYFFKDGIQISGGEWQQLALARSIMKASSLYILDEPCSSLDLQTESKVFDYLKSTTTDNICLLISHRLHNIVHFADYVMVYNKGKLIEYDTVDNLLKSDSIFKNDFFNCEALTEVTF